MHSSFPLFPSCSVLSISFVHSQEAGSGCHRNKAAKARAQKRVGKNPTRFYYSLQPLNLASNCRTLKASRSNLLVSNEKTSSHSFPKLCRHIAKRRLAAACFLVSPATSTFVASKPFLITFLFMQP